MNMIPASEPTGVRSAPKFEPIIVAYIPNKFDPPWERIDEKRAVIGMLFITLEKRKLKGPYSKTGFPFANKSAIIFVIPFELRHIMIKNIESKKGTKAQGARFKEFVIYFVSCFFTLQKIKLTINSITTKPSAIYHISRPIYELIASKTVQTRRNVAFKITKGLLILISCCSPGSIFFFNCFLNNKRRTKNETIPQETVGRAIFKKYVTKSIPAKEAT